MAIEERHRVHLATKDTFIWATVLYVDLIVCKSAAAGVEASLAEKFEWTIIRKYRGPDAFLGSD